MFTKPKTEMAKAAAEKPSRLILQDIQKQLRQGALEQAETAYLAAQTVGVLSQMRKDGKLWPSFKEIDALQQEAGAMLNLKDATAGQMQARLADIVRAALPIARGYHIYSSDSGVFAAFRRGETETFSFQDASGKQQQVPVSGWTFNQTALRIYIDELRGIGHDVGEEERALKALEAETEKTGQSDAMNSRSIMGYLIGALHDGKIVVTSSRPVHVIAAAPAPLVMQA